MLLRLVIIMIMMVIVMSSTNSKQHQETSIERERSFRIDILYGSRRGEIPFPFSLSLSLSLLLWQDLMFMTTMKIEQRMPIVMIIRMLLFKRQKPGIDIKWSGERGKNNITKHQSESKGFYLLKTLFKQFLLIRESGKSSSLSPMMEGSKSRDGERMKRLVSWPRLGWRWWWWRWKMRRWIKRLRPRMGIREWESQHHHLLK